MFLLPLPAGLLRGLGRQAAAVEDDDGFDARPQHDLHPVHAVVDVAKRAREKERERIERERFWPAAFFCAVRPRAPRPAGLTVGRGQALAGTTRSPSPQGVHPLNDVVTLHSLTLSQKKNSRQRRHAFAQLAGAGIGAFVQPGVGVHGHGCAGEGRDVRGAGDVFQGGEEAGDTHFCEGLAQRPK